MAIADLDIPRKHLAEFCRRWRIAELAVFGSALREDFGPESDVDVMVVFEDGVHHGPEAYLDLREELRSIFGRPVDLVERRLLRNPFIRHRVLSTKQTLYAA